MAVERIRRAGTIAWAVVGLAALLTLLGVIAWFFRVVWPPLILASPRLNFFGTNGSNPRPSPYAVYIASSFAQVNGKLSLPFARRLTVDAAAQRTSLITGLGG